MTDDLAPVYDYAIEHILHLRCSVCGYWWSVEGGTPTRPYHCPDCGRPLAPAQYPDDQPRQRRESQEVPL